MVGLLQLILDLGEVGVELVNLALDEFKLPKQIRLGVVVIEGVDKSCGFFEVDHLLTVGSG